MMRERAEDLVRRMTEKAAGSALRGSYRCAPPDRKTVVRIVKALQALMFPLCFSRENPYMPDDALLCMAMGELEQQIVAALEFQQEAGCKCREEAARLTERYAERLPEVRWKLQLDIEALYEGDPAASCREEVVICYPGFYAISIYRLAHELYLLEVPLIPRIMTEFAHERTGIDIHPGATVGEYFFIDHGTGIVVGETTILGNHVKLYQGVTLGARSFELDENGNPVKKIKRHPNIGNHVVIYANATILGGDTVIGDGCVIGGNSWVTHSVRPGSTVVYGNEK